MNYVINCSRIFTGSENINKYNKHIFWLCIFFSDSLHHFSHFPAVTFHFVRKVGHKYLVSNKERGSFQKASEFCSQQGAELVLPQSEEENNKLTLLIGEADQTAWINREGLESERLKFSKWAEGQPDEPIQQESCIVVSDKGYWRVSRDCSLNAYIVCQI
uniref:C-type lectin domain-containing protein n=1 Tax=Nothobranchius furzeri TaxID=105023 RepID=A0A8C6MDV2_NOTFU